MTAAMIGCKVGILISLLATGKVPHALFREQEDAQGYFLLLRQIVSGHGIPMALYYDRHSIFERSKGEPESLEEQLEGWEKELCTCQGRST